MYQNFHSANKLLSIKSRYKSLCRLYNKYKICIKIALENVPENQIADDMIIVLDKVVDDIAKFPIPWKYYIKQKHRFSQEFEDLVIFTDEISIY